MFGILIAIPILSVIVLLLAITTMVTGTKYEWVRNGITYYIKFNHVLPKLFHKSAVAIFDTIYVAGNVIAADIHAREFRRIEQWNQFGYTRFVCVYLQIAVLDGQIDNVLDRDVVQYALTNTSKFEEIRLDKII